MTDEQIAQLRVGDIVIRQTDRAPVLRDYGIVRDDGHLPEFWAVGTPAEARAFAEASARHADGGRICDEEFP